MLSKLVNFLRKPLSLKAFCVLAALGILLLAWMHLESRIIEVRTEVMESPKWRQTDTPLKIVFLTDFHAEFMPQSVLDDIVKSTEKLAPDLVILGGDYFQHTPDTATREKLTVGLQKLTARFQVFAILGNHDYNSWGKGATLPPGVTRKMVVESVLKKAGVTLLQNEKTTCNVRGETVNIVGFSDIIQASLVGTFPLAQYTDSNNFTIYAVHNPYLLEIIKGNPTFDLILMGHTHGGQIRLPWIGSVCEIILGMDYVMGPKTISDYKLAYIARGVGSIFAVRLNCQPEILCVEVHRTRTEAMSPTPDDVTKSAPDISDTAPSNP